MNGRFLLAWLVVFIVYFAGGFVIHELLLGDAYRATGLMRAPEESESLFVWMVLAHVLMAGAFTWIYARGLENKPWLGQGLRFGLAVAFLAVIPLYMIYYVVQPNPAGLAVKQIVYDTILAMVAGAVVAFMYRGRQA